MFHRARNTILWLMMSAYLLAGLAPATALVLCVGDDGHVALEWKAETEACDGCEDVESPTAHEDRSSDAGDHAGLESCGCVDVPLLVRATPLDSPRFSGTHVDVGSDWPSLMVRSLVVGPWIAVDVPRRPPTRPPDSVIACALLVARTMVLVP